MSLLKKLGKGNLDTMQAEKVRLKVTHNFARCDINAGWYYLPTCEILWWQSCSQPREWGQNDCNLLLHLETKRYWKFRG